MQLSVEFVFDLMKTSPQGELYTHVGLDLKLPKLADPPSEL